MSKLIYLSMLLNILFTILVISDSIHYIYLNITICKIPLHQNTEDLTNNAMPFQSREPLYATLLRPHRDFPSREELADANGKKLISLQVADTKYDSDSDFDYRQRPPR